MRVVGGRLYTAWQDGNLHVSRLADDGASWVPTAGSLNSNPVTPDNGDPVYDRPVLTGIAGTPYVAWSETDGTVTSLRVATLGGAPSPIGPDDGDSSDLGATPPAGDDQSGNDTGSHRPSRGKCGLNLTGTGHGDSLSGTAGRDTIRGLAGNDVLKGLAGARDSVLLTESAMIGLDRPAEPADSRRRAGAPRERGRIQLEGEPPIDLLPLLQRLHSPVQREAMRLDRRQIDPGSLEKPNRSGPDAGGDRLRAAGAVRTDHPGRVRRAHRGDAAGAEKVFRDDLERNLRNPRSLWGLHQALLQQKRGYDAGFVEKQFESSWKGGAQALKLDDLV